MEHTLRCSISRSWKKQSWSEFVETIASWLAKHVEIFAPASRIPTFVRWGYLIAGLRTLATEPSGTRTSRARSDSPCMNAAAHMVTPRVLLRSCINGNRENETGLVHRALDSYIARVLEYPHDHTTIRSTSCRRRVIGNRLRLAVASCHQLRRRHTLLDQIIAHCLRSPLRQLEVVLVRAGAIRMPLKLDPQARILL